MNIKTKLFFDRFFGQILCLLLMPAAFLIGKILRIDHSINDKNVKRIVVAKYFGMGSITHCVPMLRALKNKYPQSRITFISRIYNRQIIELIPYIDEAVYINDSGLFKVLISSFKAVLKFWKKRPDLFFDLEVFSSYGTLMSLFSLSRNRLGFFWAKSTKFKTFTYTHLLYFNFSMPLRVSYLQLSRMANTAIDASSDLEPFKIEESVCVSAKEKIREITNGKNPHILCMNVNASDLSYARRWAIGKFAEVAVNFAKKGYCVLLLGSPDEKTYVSRIYDFINDKEASANIFNAAGYFSLKEVLAVLSLCDAFLTNDAGLMNLGYAQNAKTIAIYGANNPQFVHIDNGINKAIYRQSYCSPCLYIFDSAPCGNLASCLQNITVKEVSDAVETALNTNVPRCADINQCITADKANNYIMGTLRRRA